MDLKTQAKTIGELRGIIPLLGMNEQLWVPLDAVRAWLEEERKKYDPQDKHWSGVTLINELLCVLGGK